MGWVDTSKARVELMARQQRYGQDIGRWLDAEFPDLHRHPAAVATVIRLHFLEGKGNLTKTKHGPLIRAAVRAWDQRWATKTSLGEGS